MPQTAEQLRKIAKRLALLPRNYAVIVVCLVLAVAFLGLIGLVFQPTSSGVIITFDSSCEVSSGLPTELSTVLILRDAGKSISGPPASSCPSQSDFYNGTWLFLRSDRSAALVMSFDGKAERTTAKLYDALPGTSRVVYGINANKLVFDGGPGPKMELRMTGRGIWNDPKVMSWNLEILIDGNLVMAG